MLFASVGWILVVSLLTAIRYGFSFQNGFWNLLAAEPYSAIDRSQAITRFTSRFLKHRPPQESGALDDKKGRLSWTQ